MYNMIGNSTVTTGISDAGYATLGGILGGAIVGVTFITILISIAISVITIIANWILFSKAGKAGWKTLIPIYNVITLFKIAGISPWWILGYLVAIIPVIGWVFALGVTIYAMINLAKAFGKDGGFAVGLILLNTIFIMILAFGKSEYQLDKNKTEVV